MLNINYTGGKGNCYQQIINLIPPHKVYIEPFLGGGAIMRHKKAADLNIGIDMDDELINDWIDSVANRADDSYVFWCSDARDFLRTYQFTGDEFVYIDPPYLYDVRSSKRSIYKHEMGEVYEHIEILDLIKQLGCMVMISGYWSDLYADHLRGWYTHSFTAVKRSGEVAQEFVWFNYPRPSRLHDYRHLGENYRERERIKKKKKRWLKNLQGMGILERQAILSAFDEAGIL